MSQFERDLREALRRREPRPGFAEDVLARARQAKEPQHWSWRWLAVAAVMLVMIGGFVVMREQQRRAEGEKAKQQLMVALRITGTKLRSVQERVAAVQQRAIRFNSDQ